jgi:hypothetical protein
MSDIQKFPERAFKADVEGLGIITLKELSVKYRLSVIDDPANDTPRNVLLDAGMTDEQINMLRVGQLAKLASAVIEFTYPNLLKDSKELNDVDNVEREELKKN